MSIKRALVYFCFGVFVVLVVGFGVFSTLMGARREEAVRGIVKPDVVKRYEARVAAQSQTNDAWPVESGDAVTAEAVSDEERYASYAHLAERLEAIWRGLDDKVRDLWPWASGKRLSDEQVALMLRILEDNPGLLEEIHATSRLGRPVALLDFSKGINVEFADDSPWMLGRSGPLLSAHAQSSAEKGDKDAAAHDIFAGLMLGASLSGEPLARFGGAGQNVYAESLTACLVCFEADAVGTETAQAVLERLETAHHRTAFLERLDAWSYLGNVLFEDIDNLGSRELLEKYAKGDADEFGTNIVTMLVGSSLGKPFVDLNAAKSAEVSARLRALAEQPFHESLPQIEELERSCWRQRGVLTRPGAGLAIRNSYTIAAQAVHETRVDMARVGIAVELYRDEHGAYPEMLDAVAEYLGGNVPCDPLSDGAFEYSCDGSSFELRSAGLDTMGAVNSVVRHYGEGLGWRGGVVDEVDYLM